MATDEFSDYPDTGLEGAKEYTHPQDDFIWFTSKNDYNEYEPPRPDVDYGIGATGDVSVASRQGSGGSAATFIHPFKLEKVTDPDDPNSTKVRVYAGNVFAKIDTFQLRIEDGITGMTLIIITGQEEHTTVQLGVPPQNPIPTNWGVTFNKAVLADDGENTLFTYHESDNSDGEFYVKWVITINTNAEVTTVVGSIERVAVGAARPADDPFGDLTQAGASASRDPAGRVGTFYQKIGVVNTDTIEQDQFSNINWSMTVLPEVS